jgi:hypothetical protein
MVPENRHVTADAHGRRPRRPEREIVVGVRAFLERGGYRVWTDPDGHDYFDLVARRDAEVGLVEAKVADGRKVLAQALRRRVWGDWSAVVVASERTARRLVERTTGSRASPIGIWWYDGDAVHILRESRPWITAGQTDPSAPLRERFRGVLDALDAGALPPGIPWDGVLGEVRRASGGRGFAEWSLDEPPATDGPE